MKEFENSIPEDVKVNSIIRVILYIVGSILVLFPKLFPNSKMFVQSSDQKGSQPPDCLNNQKTILSLLLVRIVEIVLIRSKMNI